MLKAAEASWVVLQARWPQSGHKYHTGLYCRPDTHEGARQVPWSKEYLWYITVSNLSPKDSDIVRVHCSNCAILPQFLLDHGILILTLSAADQEKLSICKLIYFTFCWLNLIWYFKRCRCYWSTWWNYLVLDYK